MRHADDPAILQLILDNMADGVLVVDPEGRIVQWNGTARRMLGIPDEGGAQDLGSLGGRGAVIRDAAGLVQQPRDFAIVRALRGIEVDDEVVQVRTPARPGGMWLRVCARALRDASGQLRGAVALFHDVTAQRESDRRVREHDLRYRRAWDSNLIAIMECDLDGHIHEANDAFLSLIGYGRADLDGGRLDWTRLTPPEWRARDQRAIDLLAQGGVAPPWEKEYVHKEGHRVPVLIGVALIEGQRCLCLILDLSERHRAASELKRRRDLYEALLKAQSDLGEGVAIADAAAERFIYVNQAYASIFRRSVEELMAMPSFMELAAAPGERDEQRNRMAGRMAGEAVPDHFESIAPRPDGTGVPVEVAVKRLSAEEPALFVTLVRDISARKQAEVELAKAHLELEQRVAERTVELERANADRARLLFDEQTARRAAEAASRMKDQFLATLSHELRTPLTPITGWVQLLRSGRLDEERTRRALETIDRQTRSLTHLIEDILDVSRVVTGKLRLSIRPVDLGEVVVAAVDSMALAAEARRIQITVEDTGSPPIAGDADRLRQVVWNLLANAVKFTPEGGAVQVRLESAGGRVRLAVSDNGKGIAQEFLPHIFERFRQGTEDVTTRTHGGLGLGLSIVRHLVELHGGTVTAESEGEGRGATFAVELPTRRQPAPTPTPVPPAGARSLSAPTQLQGVRVLLVEDDPDAAELITMMLEMRGAAVETAESAEQALASLDRLVPDVLVSDIAMPGEDGHELIRRVRLRGTEVGGRLPAVALTAHAHSENRRRALDAGFQVHLAKPADPEELARAVARLVGREPSA